MTAGLLHAAGRFLQARCFGEEFKRLWIQRTGGRASLRTPTAGQEFMQFRADYTHLGDLMFSHWEVPMAIRALVRQQVQPASAEAPARVPTLLLYVATQAAQAALQPEEDQLERVLERPMVQYRLDTLAESAEVPVHTITQVLHTRNQEIRAFAMSAVNALRN
ncbi:MAG: hypothetical protein RhofKO_37450 [Rhodothermales bacterium]